MLFHPGKIVATPGALEVIERGGNLDAWSLLRRHCFGVWGDLDDHDKQMNEIGARNGERILSCYGEGDNRLYVITDAVEGNPRYRAVTTILRPDEY